MFKPRFKFRLFISMAVLGCLGNQAFAADLIATKPGVMCTSTQTLAQLTLPDGNSRSHGDTATAAQLAEAQAGGCIDIQPGMTVTVQTAHKNTSVVSYTRPGSNASEKLVIPNIDFVPVFADDDAP
jgi:hypothetical protein